MAYVPLAMNEAVWLNLLIFGGTLAQLQQKIALGIELIVVLRIALIRVLLRIALIRVRLRIELGLS